MQADCGKWGDIELWWGLKILYSRKSLVVLTATLYITFYLQYYTLCGTEVSVLNS